MRLEVGPWVGQGAALCWKDNANRIGLGAGARRVYHLLYGFSFFLTCSWYSLRTERPPRSEFGNRSTDKTKFFILTTLALMSIPPTTAALPELSYFE